MQLVRLTCMRGTSVEGAGIGRQARIGAQKQEAGEWSIRASADGRLVMNFMNENDINGSEIVERVSG